MRVFRIYVFLTIFLLRRCKMKKIKCLFAISLVLIIASGAIAGNSKHGVSPPSGDHFKFNLVTEWADVTGAIDVVVDTNSLDDVVYDANNITGDLAIYGVILPSTIAAGDYTLEGTGDYDGWIFEITIADPCAPVVEIGYTTTTYPVTGHIEKPHEILVPLSGATTIGINEGDYMVADNDATDGDGAMQVPAGSYDTFDQARGKPGGEVTFGDLHQRLKKKPVWVKHNGGRYPTLIISGNVGPWVYDNAGCTNYAFRMYKLE
jgi:hypothetical protein